MIRRQQERFFPLYGTFRKNESYRCDDYTSNGSCSGRLRTVAVIENGVLVEQGLVSEIFANPRTKTTREFLRNISHSGDERTTDSSFVRWSDKGGKFELRFKGDSPGKPILSQAAKKFDVDFNILAAGIENLPENQVGQMAVDIIGSAAEIKKAVDFLEENDVSVREEK